MLNYRMKSKSEVLRVCAAMEYFCKYNRDYFYAIKNGSIILYHMPHDICEEVEKYYR